MFSRQNKNEFSGWGLLGRFLLMVVSLFFFTTFIIWRIDNPRIEDFRMRIMDALPEVKSPIRPVETAWDILRDYQSYQDLRRENKTLRREIENLKIWHQRALELEAVNAELRVLNNLALPQKSRVISSDVIADSGSPFSQTVLINAGELQKIPVGAPVVDAFGLVGRIISTGKERSRILLLTDPNSKISAITKPDNIHAMIVGQNRLKLGIIGIDSIANFRAGTRIETSGDGIFPNGLLIGYVQEDANGNYYVQPSARLTELNFVRTIINDDRNLSVGEVEITKLNHQSETDTTNDVLLENDNHDDNVE